MSVRVADCVRTVTLTPAFLRKLLEQELSLRPPGDGLLAGMQRLNFGELNAVLHGNKRAKVRKARVLSMSA